MAQDLHTIAVLFSNSVDRKLLSDFIVSLGYRVRYPNPDLAKPDEWAEISLVIMDEAVGRRHGKRLVEIKNHSEIFLALLVAVQKKGAIAAWLKSGFDDALQLPLAKGELRRRLRTFLRIREQAEQLANDKEAVYRSLVESSSDHIFLLNREGIFLASNKRGEKALLNADKTLIGSSLRTAYCPEAANLIYDQIEKVFESRRPATFEHSMQGVDGTRYYQVTLFPVVRDRSVWAIGGISRDVTRLKVAEDQIKASLKEKEVLLRELYHRTKNNMQVIIALLHLQSSNIKDKGTIDLFRETENRIKSMAMVHEKLYQAKNLSSIDLGEYIRDLLHLLSGSYRIRPEVVAVSADLDRIFVTIDTAIPCGLIINELISNCLKYAFPGNMRGEVRVGLTRKEGSVIEIMVKDNGVGLPQNFDIDKSKSLGLRTVKNLTKYQLKGELSFTGHKGTEFRIRFPEHLREA